MTGTHQDTADAAWEEALEDALEAEAMLDHDQALARYQAIRAQAGNTTAGRRARLCEVRLWLRLGRNDEATVVADALVADCTVGGNGSECADALAERAHVGYRSGDGEALTRFSGRAVEVARAGTDPTVTAHALRYAGIAAEFAGRHAEAEGIYVELLEMAPDHPHLGGVCNSLGEIARATGRFGTAARWYKRSHEEWRRTRGDEPNIVYLNNMGAAMVQLGRLDDGRMMLTRAIQEQRRSGHLAMLSETYYYRGLAAREAGDLEAASQDVVEGYLLAAELGEGEMLGRLLRLLAQIRAGDAAAEAGGAIGGSATPEELLLQSIAILTEAGKPAEAARSHWALGWILKASDGGRLDEARLALSQARQMFTALDMPHWADLVAIDELAFDTADGARR